MCLDWFPAFQAGKRLDMVQWTVSYQGFALAAAAVGMWDYHLAMAHHTVCMKVACESTLASYWLIVCSVAFVFCFAGRANSHDKRHQLAQVYDEVCRKEWFERSFRGLYE